MYQNGFDFLAKMPFGWDLHSKINYKSCQETFFIKLECPQFYEKHAVPKEINKIWTKRLSRNSVDLARRQLYFTKVVKQMFDRVVFQNIHNPCFKGCKLKRIKKRLLLLLSEKEILAV